MYCAPHNGKMENDRNNLKVQSCVSAIITTLHSLREIDFFLNRFSRWAHRIYNRPTVNYFECEETDHFIDKSV